MKEIETTPTRKMTTKREREREREMFAGKMRVIKEKRNDDDNEIVCVCVCVCVYVCVCTNRRQIFRAFERTVPPTRLYMSFVLPCPMLVAHDFGVNKKDTHIH